MKKMLIMTMCILLLAGCTPADNAVTETAADTAVSQAETTTAQEETEESVASEETAFIDETEETAATSETAETEPPNVIIEPTFISEEAERLYTIIMSDTKWRTEETVGATIVDLQDDGSPEFLAASSLDDGCMYNVSVFAFGEDKTEYLYSFATDRPTLPKYVDNGVTKWWVSSYSTENVPPSQSYKSTTEYGLMSFLGDAPESEILFKEYSEYDEKTDIYNSEQYINGELYGTDRVENYYHLEEAPSLSYHGWYMKKAEWEVEHLSGSNNYALCPNEHWLPDTDISNDIIMLANAYCNNDTDYLTRIEYYGEVGAFKPVIYLYPEEKTDVSVRLDLDGALTCTYPDYGSGWDVTALPDGTLYDGDGYEYSYLYWEGRLCTEWDMSEGFVVRGEDTAEFLREKLSYMGLTPREYNEFIVYWLPLMQDNPYNLITFQAEAYTEAARLDISPAPDSILRIFMVYSPLTEPVELPEQQLSPFERSGFTVVEWGGTSME